MCITTGTVVLITLHKKADLLETNVNDIKDIKVCVNKNKWKRMDAIGLDRLANAGKCMFSTLFPYFL